MSAHGSSVFIALQAGSVGVTPTLSGARGNSWLPRSTSRQLTTMHYYDGRPVNIVWQRRVGKQEWRDLSQLESYYLEKHWDNDEEYFFLSNWPQWLYVLPLQKGGPSNKRSLTLCRAPGDRVVALAAKGDGREVLARGRGAWFYMDASGCLG
jgi:hypothetical protein